MRLVILYFLLYSFQTCYSQWDMSERIDWPNKVNLELDSLFVTHYSISSFNDFQNFQKDTFLLETKEVLIESNVNHIKYLKTNSIGDTIKFNLSEKGDKIKKSISYRPSENLRTISYVDTSVSLIEKVDSFFYNDKLFCIRKEILNKGKQTYFSFQIIENDTIKVEEGIIDSAYNILKKWDVVSNRVVLEQEIDSNGNLLKKSYGKVVEEFTYLNSRLVRYDKKWPFAGKENAVSLFFNKEGNLTTFVNMSFDVAENYIFNYKYDSKGRWVLREKYFVTHNDSKLVSFTKRLFFDKESREN